MNKNIKLAVAGAVLALSATANAGIVIPAGDWTVDINGNVNTFSTYTRHTGDATIAGGYAGFVSGANDTGARNSNNITTGLLPNYLGVTGTTRQNDLDVSFTISINPGSSVTQSGGQSAKQENRQAFLTFGDKSWGSVKVGKDLGIFASDAILNDMTLLGVGGGAGALAGNTTTLGRIGTGFIYADWKSQLAYTTPNMSGFQATFGLTQAFNARGSAWGTEAYTADSSGDVSETGLTAVSSTSSGRSKGQSAYEAKASYSFASNDVTGKVWVSGISQKARTIGASAVDQTVTSADIGANINFAGFGLTGYYYSGKGIGTTMQLLDGFDLAGNRRDSDGGYVQATYVLPTKTKLGVSWGRSNLDKTSADSDNYLIKENEMWTVGAYHPLTKHLNLVAEYSDAQSKNQANAENTNRTGSLGAILFF
jgi:predicted porin